MTDYNNLHKPMFLMDEGISYLNCANMSPMLKSVRDAGLQALETRAAPWKLSSADWFKNAEILRGLAAQIFQTKDSNIALVPSASYGLAVAAKNMKLPAGKEIIILDRQFPSNYYVWQNLAQQCNLQIVTVQKTKNKSITENILEKINNKTAIIAIPNCHWIDGMLIDLQQVSNAARAVGSCLVLDLSQSLGALPTDIDAIKPDFAVCVGYKWLLGPYGLGYMYVSEKWQERGEPLEYSWLTKKGSDDFARLTDYATEYRSGARKFDMGEFPQLNLLPMAIAALEQIIAWKVTFIQTEIKKLTDRITRNKNQGEMLDEPFLRAGHIISIPLDDLNVKDLQQRLQKNKVVVSFRERSIRVSPHLYNDLSDIDKLLGCLQN